MAKRGEKINNWDEITAMAKAKGVKAAAAEFNVHPTTIRKRMAKGKRRTPRMQKINTTGGPRIPKPQASSLADAISQEIDTKLEQRLKEALNPKRIRQLLIEALQQN